MAKNLGTFTTASVSEIIKVSNQKTHIFTVTSTNVTSTVLVRIEFSNDDIDYYNVAEFDYKISEDGIDNLSVTENVPVNFLRFRYLSGTGILNVSYTNY